MPKPPHRTLRVVLGFFSLLAALAGLLMIFAEKPLLIRLFLRPPESEFSTLFLFTLKELGGILFLVSALLFFASRDPVRNVAILDAFILALCVLTVTPLLSLYTLDTERLYPSYLIWGRSVVRLALAGLLYSARPRGAPSRM